MIMYRACFGLIGYPLSHSFSKTYYINKFEQEGIKDMGYELYPLSSIQVFSQLIQQHSNLMGVNVTIPYKVAVLPFIDELSPEAKAIGAVNCIRIHRSTDGQTFLSGYNTDVYGFSESLKPLLKPEHTQALVLGNGGAARAVCYALEQLGIDFMVACRQFREEFSNQIHFEELNNDLLAQYKLIINTTPLGTFPKVEEAPAIPYEALTSAHLLYDLIYNPEETAFLKAGRERGATIKNGYEMLVFQAEKNWDIWMADEADKK